MFRSIEELRRDQQAILEAYRQERRDAGTAVSAEGTGEPCGSEVGYGRVVEAVGDDPLRGPHLLVVRLAWSGTPPIPLSVGMPPVCCHPSPVHALDDYPVNCFVRLAVTDGAIVAEPLG